MNKTVEITKQHKKKREPGTPDTARAFIAKASVKGLRYWSAVDYLNKIGGVTK
jgi:hypothetical protein